DLLELEHQGCGSLCRGTGADFYGHLMLNDAVMTLADGYTFDRQEVIDSLNEAPAWSGYEITEPHLIQLTDESAVLVYRGTAWRDVDRTQFWALMSSVYVSKDGAWRLASYQQTPIPE